VPGVRAQEPGAHPGAGRPPRAGLLHRARAPQEARRTQGTLLSHTQCSGSEMTNYGSGSSNGKSRILDSDLGLLIKNLEYWILIWILPLNYRLNFGKIWQNSSFYLYINRFILYILGSLR